MAAYHKTRYFKAKILPPGRFAQSLQTVLSQCAGDLSFTQLKFMKSLPNGYRESYDNAKFEHLNTLCDLGADYYLRIWSTATFKIDEANSVIGRIFIGFQGFDDIINIDVEAAEARYTDKIFDSIINDLLLEETVSRQETILRVLQADDLSVDFVIVTELPEERDAILNKLPGYQQLPPTKEDIRTYYQTDLPVTFADSSIGQYKIVVMSLLGMGRVQAAIATGDAIRRWHPRFTLMVGIAGGMASRNVQIGDILISDQVIDYELQKLTSNGPEFRWEIHRTDPRLLDTCNNYKDESWHDLIMIKRPTTGKPKRHIGPIVSGDKVIAFGEVLAKYRDVWPKLIGVEMEAAGVATASFQASDKPGFFMIRGGDLADENKNTPNVKKWRQYACDISASFTISWLRSGPVPLSA